MNTSGTRLSLSIDELSRSTRQSTLCASTDTPSTETPSNAKKVAQTLQQSPVARSSWIVTANFTIPLAFAVLVVAASVVAVSGFPQLAIMYPNGGDPVEAEGIKTYNTTLFGATGTALSKFLNELTMFASMGTMMYLTAFWRNPYNISEPPNQATWDVPIHKWFLAEASKHPDRRFFYVDAGSWQWTGEELRAGARNRLVGTAWSNVAFRYQRNTTPSSMPLRYNLVDTVNLIYNPVETALTFLSVTNEPVWLLLPFLDHEGKFSYAFAMRMINMNAFRLQGVFLMFVPVEEFINPSLYNDTAPRSCSLDACSATFDGLGALVATTVPSIPDIYVSADTPNAVCVMKNNFTRCRHSLVTVARAWPQFDLALKLRPDMKTTQTMNFDFVDGNNDAYLSSSGSTTLNGEFWLSVVITPGDKFIGTYFKTRRMIVYIVVGAGLASWAVAILFIFAIIRRLSQSLDDMTAALALRARKEKKSDFDIRREMRTREYFAFSEIMELDDSVDVLQQYLERLSSLLPPPVINAMRNNVYHRRRSQRKAIRSRWGWLSCCCAHSQRDETTDSGVEYSLQEPVEGEHVDEGLIENEVDKASRVGSLSRNALHGLSEVDIIVANDSAAAAGEEQRPTIAMDPEDFNFVPNDSIFTQLGDGVVSDPDSASPRHSDERPQGILVASSVNSRVIRRKSVFASVSFSRARFSSAAAFQHVVRELIKIVWKYRGDVELIRASRFVASFGCYDELPDPEGIGCACALEILRTFSLFAASSNAGVTGHIGVVLDAGRFEDCTLTAKSGDGRLIRNRVIRTAAMYAADKINDLADVFLEPLIVTQDVRQKLKNMATTLVDHVRFLSTCVPRLARRGGIQLFKVELRSSGVSVAILRVIRTSLMEALNSMLVGNYGQAYAILNEDMCSYSLSARRFRSYCQIMIAKGRGHPPAVPSGTSAKALQTQFGYYRGEVLDWVLYGSEVSYYDEMRTAADGATGRQHFRDEPDTIILN